MEEVYDVLVGNVVDKEPTYPIIEDMTIEGSVFEELGFSIEEVRNKKRYVLYTLNDMFNMYSSPIEEGNLKVFPMWQVDPLSEFELRKMVKIVNNIQKRFGDKTEEE